jgi:hypothetical protein
VKPLTKFSLTGSILRVSYYSTCGEEIAGMTNRQADKTAVLFSNCIMDFLHFVLIQVTDLFQKHVSFDE